MPTQKRSLIKNEVTAMPIPTPCGVTIIL